MAPRRSDPLYNNDTVPQIRDVYMLGKDTMNRAGKRLGTLTPGGPEDRRLRSFFGAGVVVILDAWYRMAAQDLIPDGGKFYHLLWALMFMKIYSSESTMCGHAGGVDPKTWRKWIWPFVRGLSDLEYTVVRFFCFCSRPVSVLCSYCL